MFMQLLIGSGLTVATVIFAVLVWGFTESRLSKLHVWSLTPPHGPKLMTILALTLLGTLAMMTVAVWGWAIAFRLLGLFETFEASVYFALVSFTTLGFGDVLLPQEWQLLGGLAAANGLLLFGLLTAIVVETLREIRVRHKRDHH